MLLDSFPARGGGTITAVRGKEKGKSSFKEG